MWVTASSMNYTTMPNVAGGGLPLHLHQEPLDLRPQGSESPNQLDDPHAWHHHHHHHIQQQQQQHQHQHQHILHQHQQQQLFESTGPANRLTPSFQGQSQTGSTGSSTTLQHLGSSGGGGGIGGRRDSYSEGVGSIGHIHLANCHPSQLHLLQVSSESSLFVDRLDSISIEV